MKILIFVLCLSIYSCVGLPSCQEYESSYAEDSVHMVLSGINFNGRSINLRGINPATGKETTFQRIDGFFIAMNDTLQIGDTLIKDWGNVNYIIKKRDRNIIFKNKCDSAVSITTRIKQNTIKD